MEGSSELWSRAGISPWHCYSSQCQGIHLPPSSYPTAPCLQGKEVQTKNESNGPWAIKNDAPQGAAFSTDQRQLNKPSAGESTSSGVMLSPLPMNIPKIPQFSPFFHI